LHRKHLRLKHYNYGLAGFYFVTVCVAARRPLFGRIDAGLMNLNPAGKMVASIWSDLPNHFNPIQLHDFIVMPNHFHGIIQIHADHVEAPLVGALVDNDFSNLTNVSKIAAASVSRPAVLGEIVGAFKSLTTNAYIKGVKENGWLEFDKKVWQRNYYEHVIRNEESYRVISEYIQTNPQRWKDDTYFVS